MRTKHNKPAALTKKSSRAGASTGLPVRIASSQSAALTHAAGSIPPPQSEPRRRGDDVRERVLSAALDCFGAYGFEGTSTRTVAQRAGVTHTLVLYHFQSKDKLWISMMDHVLHGYLSGMHESADTETKTAADQLATFIEQFVRLTASKPQVHRIMTMESNQGTSRLRWVIDTYLRSHFKKIVDLIRMGQMEGRVRQCDPARLYYLIIGAGGTPFTIATEYKEFTGRDVFSETEVLRIIAFIYEIVFDSQ